MSLSDIALDLLVEHYKASGGMFAKFMSEAELREYLSAAFYKMASVVSIAVDEQHAALREEQEG